MVANLPGVRIGAVCEIAIESADGYGEYKSRIEDLQDDRLTVAMPTHRGAFVIPAIGDPLDVIVPTPGGGTLFLESEVLGRQSEPLPLLNVRVVSVGQRQARGYYRVTNLTVRPTECAVWDISDGRDEAFWRPVRAIVQDMSGGGCGLLADEEMPVGSRARIRFPLPFGGGECVGIGEVKMCRPHGSRGGINSARRGEQRYIVGLQMDEITRRTRERLIKAVHRYQAEERRVGNA
ncbi:MAG TPA: flagellar brake protein [Chloroflexota bacterium]|nr:flagellar brake protein [Chloroflexota bacterium]